MTKRERTVLIILGIVLIVLWLLMWWRILVVAAFEIALPFASAP